MQTIKEAHDNFVQAIQEATGCTPRISISLFPKPEATADKYVKALDIASMLHEVTGLNPEIKITDKARWINIGPEYTVFF